MMCMALCSLPESIIIIYYRRHRFISTCAYRSNSGDMGAKKRAGAYKREYRGHAHACSRGAARGPYAHEANLRVKENGLELG